MRKFGPPVIRGVAVDCFCVSEAEMKQIPLVLEPDKGGRGVFYIVGVYNAQGRAQAEKSQLGATRDCILVSTSDG